MAKTTVDPVFSITAKDLALLCDEQFTELCCAADRLQRLLAVDKQRRRDEAFSGYDVLMAELRAAYADIDRESYEADPDRSAQAMGRYEGLSRAYVLLTGRSDQDVANEVVTWYVGTPEYQAAKERERLSHG